MNFFSRHVLSLSVEHNLFNNWKNNTQMQYFHYNLNVIIGFIFLFRFICLIFGWILYKSIYYNNSNNICFFISFFLFFVFFNSQYYWQYLIFSLK